MNATRRPRHDLESLLEFIKRSRGFDFSGYKRASLERRIEKRMQAVDAADFDGYVDLLEANPDEFAELFNTVLINVTRFFRDTTPWDSLIAEIIPRLMATKGPDENLRVWSAGCASGEEAYTLAMVCAEALGSETFRSRVKIYATDIDDDALATARAASYDERDLSQVPPPLVERYFEARNGRMTFRKDLRRNVIFGRNDLIQDAPISRIDLLVCRNTLMYFTAETQARILARFHFALNDNAVLVLGRAETLLTHHNAFAPIDRKARLFMKVPRLTLRNRVVVPASLPSDGGDGAGGQSRLHETAFDASIVPQIIVDHAGALAAANESARAMFAISAIDIGRPLQDLEVSYRPVELRSLIDQVLEDKAVHVARDVAVRTAAGDRIFEVHVVPLSDGLGEPAGVSVAFVDVTTTSRLQRSLERSSAELGTAFEELQSANEELETTNEELHSMNEELETTNEELQSTNEELQTMNEELQSTNEELHATNDELQVRSAQVQDLNAFLESVLSSIRGGVAVLDPEMRVTQWNTGAEELWGVSAEEAIGTHFLNMDIGIDMLEVAPNVRLCLAGQPSPVTMIRATNRRGKPIECEVRCAPLMAPDDEVPRGAIVMMESRTPLPGVETSGTRKRRG